MEDNEIINQIRSNEPEGVRNLKYKYNEFLESIVTNCNLAIGFEELCLQDLYRNINTYLVNYNNNESLGTYLNFCIRQIMIRNFLYCYGSYSMENDIISSFLKSNNTFLLKRTKKTINHYLENSNKREREFFIRRYFNMQYLAFIQRDMKMYRLIAEFYDFKIKCNLGFSVSKIINDVEKIDLKYVDEFNKLNIYNNYHLSNNNFKYMIYSSRIKNIIPWCALLMMLIIIIFIINII